jgi:hypothetical protein
MSFAPYAYGFWGIRKMHPKLGFAPFCISVFTRCGFRQSPFPKQVRGDRLRKPICKTMHKPFWGAFFIPLKNRMHSVQNPPLWLV